MSEEEVMRVENPHQNDAFAAAQDAVDERFEKVRDVAKAGFPDGEASRQIVGISNGDVTATTFDLFEREKKSIDCQFEMRQYKSARN